MKNEANHEKKPLMPLTKEQAKLLESALRIQILRVLSQEPCTSKQVADVLQRTPGNVHYHMQKLAEAELIELVDTQVVKGVTEKYYFAKTTRFKAAYPAPYVYESNSPVYHAFTRLFLNDEQRAQFQNELDDLLERWEALAAKAKGQEYAVQFQLTPHSEEDDPEKSNTNS